jgi:hypothetical protein
MPTVRQLLLDAVAARFASIPALASKVFPWRVSPVEPDGIPCCILRDVSCESRISGTQVHYHNLKMQADFYASGPVAARDLMQLAYQSIGLDRKWGGLAINTEPLNDSMMATQEEKLLGGARMEFIIGFRTPSFDPYNVNL